jgi:hypothetical protein
MWAHFAVSTSNTTVNFYYNGDMIDTQAMISPLTLPANANVELSTNGENG